MLPETKQFQIFESFMVMKNEIMSFWVVTQCSDVVRYKHSGGSCYCHLQTEEYGAWKWTRYRTGRVLHPSPFLLAQM
jgi:hypothetical protein